MIEQELLDYISAEIAYDRAEPLAPDDALLDGALDSVDVLRLVVFVEERYGVTVGDDDLVPENFATASTLATFIRGKQAG